MERAAQRMSARDLWRALFKSLAQYPYVHTCEVFNTGERTSGRSRKESPQRLQSKVAPPTKMERPPNRQALGKVLRVLTQTNSYKV